MHSLHWKCAQLHHGLEYKWITPLRLTFSWYFRCYKSNTWPTLKCFICSPSEFSSVHCNQCGAISHSGSLCKTVSKRLHTSTDKHHIHSKNYINIHIHTHCYLHTIASKSCGYLCFTLVCEMWSFGLSDHAAPMGAGNSSAGTATRLMNSAYEAEFSVKMSQC